MQDTFITVPTLILFELNVFFHVLAIARQGGTYVFIREEIGEYILTVIMKYIILLIVRYISRSSAREIRISYVDASAPRHPTTTLFFFFYWTTCNRTSPVVRG
jgi:hypothetical protein